MSDKKILIISTYPIANPRDGGQKRVNAIVKEYKKAFKQVKFMAVFKGRYPSYDKDDIYVPTDGSYPAHLIPFIGDVIAGSAIFSDSRIKNKMVKILRQYQPDIIQIEQTFPYIGLKLLLEELNMNPKLVLSSHNVEYRMKQEILDGLGVPAADSKPIIKKIREAEEELSKRATLVIAVSKDDIREHKKMGAKRLVLAPNGIERVAPSQEAVEYWRNYFKDKAIKYTASFIGSAHPPNWEGFKKMVGDRMGFVPPDTRMVLAGSIADYFQDNFKDMNLGHMTFWQRVIPVGRLDENKLAGLIAATDVILLPITEGGGSNLKTAEAILSGRKIVATSYAFRSFEKYRDLPNIFIADDPDRFRQNILKAISSPLTERTKPQIELAEKVQWHYSLKGAVKEVSEL
ncbi:MAG TPA: glycosyltransferase [Candidatus Saccharimonadales bacterium]|nr:glycosyltransferase [Candidatus Saccharimonadales bacterium]